MAWEKVDHSIETAIAGGILSVILEDSGNPRVVNVFCDPNQRGDEVEMVVELSGKPSNVFLRLVVTEVRKVKE